MEERVPRPRVLGIPPKTEKNPELCGIIMEINNLHKPLVGNQRLASAAAQGAAGQANISPFWRYPFFAELHF
jgi:hypothetical protein